MAHRGRHSADSVLLAALAAGRTAQQAAQEAHVGVRTVTRRLADADFRAALAAARQVMVAQALGVLAGAAQQAAETLERNLTCGTPSVEIAAARTILTEAQAAIALTEVQERLAALESRLGTAPLRLAR